MSLASRLPYRTSSVPASWPKLVDGEARIDRGAIRRELQARSTGPAAWSVDRVLALIFQKVRLQRKWVLADIEQMTAMKDRLQIERAALDAEAENVAERLNFNTTSLRFHLDRWSFGSLADTFRAPHMRDVYRRALDIAIERRDAPVLQAAE